MPPGRPVIREGAELFMKHLETTGWPPEGRMANADVFDQLVADRLKERGGTLIARKIPSGNQAGPSGVCCSASPLPEIY